MKSATLSEDLKALSTQANANAARNLVERAYFAASPDAATLLEVGVALELGAFRTLALLLKADWEAYEKRRVAQEEARADIERRQREFHGHEPHRGDTPVSEPWQPWADMARWGELLATLNDCPAPGRLDVLLLEQWALGCHQLAALELVALAWRHAQATALLDGAPAHMQAQFLADKREWLQQEFQLACLIDARKVLGDDMERARWDFLMIVQGVYPDLVAAAQHLALWKFRERFDDPTFTAQEMQERLAVDLTGSDDAAASVVLEPELRNVLLDSLTLEADLASIRRVQQLAQAGALSAVSSEDMRHATTLFRKLARKIHPDALAQHPHYDSISAANKQALAEIWQQASATYRQRAYLEPKRLLNYIENLENWHERVDRILRNLAFHAPDRLVEGDTLAAQWDWIKQSLTEVARYLHAVREELVRLQLDPQYLEHLRVIRLSEQERLAERARMAQQARSWKAQADDIQRQMECRA